MTHIATGTASDHPTAHRPSGAKKAKTWLEYAFEWPVKSQQTNWRMHSWIRQNGGYRHARGLFTQRLQCTPEQEGRKTPYSHRSGIIIISTLYPLPLKLSWALIRSSSVNVLLLFSCSLACLSVSIWFHRALQNSPELWLLWVVALLHTHARPTAASSLLHLLHLHPPAKQDLESPAVNSAKQAGLI